MSNKKFYIRKKWSTQYDGKTYKLPEFLFFIHAFPELIENVPHENEGIHQERQVPGEGGGVSGMILEGDRERTTRMN